MTFDELNLNKPLLNALEDLDYVNPTPIQIASFNPIMAGRDILGTAQTGTGKTFAYLLPLLRMLKYTKDNVPRILIVVPTRELVVQVVQEVEKLTKYMTVRVGGVYGGTNINTQKKIVENGLEILVGTPGRLIDLSLCRALKVKGIKKLVIDEFDEILKLGFRTQLKTILDLLPQKRQNLLFSATKSEEMQALVETFFMNPEVIEIAPHGTPLAQIEQFAYDIPNFNSKVSLLEKLLQTDEEFNKVLVFCKSKRMADLLFEDIRKRVPDQADVIHSNKSQNYRLGVVKKFQEEQLRVLIATDIIARGLDISDVSHVVNFDMPEEPEIYIHRIGRTGRADQPGIAISFIRPEEKELQTVIEELMGMEISILPLPDDVTIVETLIEEEKKAIGGDKAYLPGHSLKNSKGAFHQKKLKNTKVNRAQEKRRARKIEKQKSKKRPR